MGKFKKIVSTIMLAVMIAAVGDAGVFSKVDVIASENINNYPVQKANIVGKTGKYLQYNNSKELMVGEQNNSQNQDWQFVYIKDNIYKIIGSNGQVISPVNMEVSEGALCNLQKDKNLDSQYWTIDALEKDVLGNYLTYRIASYADNTLALTYEEDGNLKLSKYSSANNQKWLFNSAGLQGFAGYSLDMNGNEKASTIGGLLGRTVYVDNLQDFIKYSAGDTATTIVITKDISVDVPAGYKHLDSDEKLLTKIKVGKNKTIIGSYGVSLNNIYFYLDQYSNSGNFIIKNLTIKHDETLDLNNFIPMYISQGENFWIDHVTFAGHDSYSSKFGTIQEIHQKGIDENNHAVDKFVYVGVKADYVTISDSKFDNHEYGLILGYPNENSELIMNTYTGYPRMTMSGNYFTRMYCRAPGLMRYGNYHTLNNFVDDAHLGYTLYTRATVYSEANYYSGVKGVLDDKLCAGFTDKGSYPSTKAKVSPESKWNPSENYKYKVLSAEEARKYCIDYSGAQTSADTFKYVKDLFDNNTEDDSIVSDEENSKDDVVTEEKPSEEETVKPGEDVQVKEPVIHNFTLDGKNSSFFIINGSLSSSKGKVEYNGLTLSQCLKLESATSVEFTTTEEAKLTLVFNSNFNKDILIDGTRYSAQNGVAIVNLEAGKHIIKKADSCNLYYMGLYY